MNLLFSIVIICGIIIITNAAPHESKQSSDLNIRNRRRVPSSSYTRTKEGVQVAIPGLEVTTDIITTTDATSEEGVTVLGNTEDNSLTDEKVLSSEKESSTTSSYHGDSGMKLATSPTTPENTETVSKEPNVSQSTITPNKEDQGSFFNKGPLGLPIPNPFSGLKKLPAIPTGIPNIFGR